jgi:hypothetical protein
MSKTRKFVRPDTGETKEFTEGSYRIDNTSMHSQSREIVEVSFYQSSDGGRIDRKPDGSFQDKYGTVWTPLSALR